MFTYIFNQQRNIPKLEKFISVILDITYSEVHNNLKVMPRNLKKLNPDDAYKEVDLLLKLENKLLKINIEINSILNINRLRRNIVYVCTITSSNYKKGDKNYSNIYNSIQINFNIIDKITEEFYGEYTLRSVKTNKELNNIIRVDMINLEKMNKVCYNKFTEKEQMIYNFCKLLQTTDEKEFKKISEVVMEKEESKDLLRQVEDLSNDDEYIYMDSTYSSLEEQEEDYKKMYKEEGLAEGLAEGRAQGRAEGIAQGRAQGRVEGLAEGIEQRNIDIVKNMLSLNLDYDIISKSTGLTKEEIIKINEIK